MSLMYVESRQGQGSAQAAKHVTAGLRRRCGEIPFFAAVAAIGKSEVAASAAAVGPGTSRFPPISRASMTAAALRVYRMTSPSAHTRGWMTRAP